MGLDMYARRPSGDLLNFSPSERPGNNAQLPWADSLTDEPDSERLDDPVLREAFEAAVKRIMNADLNVDAGLHLGMLSTSRACLALIRSRPGWRCGDPHNDPLFNDDGVAAWTVEEVKTMHETACWPERLDPSPGGDASAIASAREFLRVCAEQGLGITLSW